MSTLLEDEPLVLEQADDATPCMFVECGRNATWSALWSCGEVGSYCAHHLDWLKGVAAGSGVSCSCPGVEDDVRIYLAMVVPL